MSGVQLWLLTVSAKVEMGEGDGDVTGFAGAWTPEKSHRMSRSLFMK